LDSDVASIYGCCGLFDMCADEDLISLSMEGSDPFLDWLGFEGTDICVIKKSFITWVRPETAAGVCTGGYLADPCADPNGTEWGECDFTLEDFGRVRRHGPVRDITMHDVRYCERQPRYRLDGSMINDDREYDARVISEVVLQDLRNLTITGNAATGGQWDGLQQLVNSAYTNSTGRRCGMMDSLIVDWNGNNMNGGAGITWNGGAIGAAYNFVDVLLDVFRRIRQRIMWSPTLASQQLAVGDVILMMPTWMTRCLLDFYTCWSVCEGTQYNEVALQAFEARTFRQNLNGGMFGYGRIFLDGFEIPLIGYDWSTISGPTTGDVYLLTGSVGSVKTIQYQYLNMSSVPGSGYNTQHFASDGGRFLHWTQEDHTCVQQVMEMRPRMLAWAPWALARFQDVVCNTPTGPLSADPCEGSFFPETSFSVASCP